MEKCCYIAFSPGLTTLNLNAFVESEIGRSACDSDHYHLNIVCEWKMRLLIILIEVVDEAQCASGLLQL